MDEDEAGAPAAAVLLDMLAAVAAPEEDLVETPEAFLTGVSAALKAADEVDVDLAAILARGTSQDKKGMPAAANRDLKGRAQVKSIVRAGSAGFQNRPFDRLNRCQGPDARSG